MGQKHQVVVVPFVRLQEKDCESTLNAFSKRVLNETFGGDQKAFDEAFLDASTEQMLGLIEAIAEIKTDSDTKYDIREEMFDAMIGVMKQWLDEHKADDEDIVREAYAGLL